MNDLKRQLDEKNKELTFVFFAMIILFVIAMTAIFAAIRNHEKANHYQSMYTFVQHTHDSCRQPQL